MRKLSLLLGVLTLMAACNDDDDGGGVQSQLLGTPLDAEVSGSGERMIPDFQLTDLENSSTEEIPPTGLLCHEMQPLEMSEQEGEGFVLEGETQRGSRFDGSCARDTEGAEAVVRFVPPTAGFWEFSTEGSEFDTILFALTDCNAGFSELSCNDNLSFEERYSLITAELEAEQPIFLVVDSAAGIASQPFKLGARPIPSTPPLLESVVARFNPENYAVGIRAIGVDPEEDVERFRLRLLKNGRPVSFQGQEIDFQDNFAEVENEEGRFEATLVGGLSAELPSFDGVELSVQDRLGLWSEVIEADVNRPVEAEAEAVCDPGGAFDLCVEGYACLDRDEDEAYSCSVTTAPILSKGDAYINLELGAIGAEIRGRDAEGDARFMILTPLNAMGMAIGPTEGFFLRFTHSTGGNEFEAYSGFNFPSSCGAQRFNECMTETGGNGELCSGEANAASEECQGAMPAIARVEVKVGDQVELLSEPLSLELAPTPEVEVGASCDLSQGTAICPGETICANYGEVEEAPLCQAAQQICPASWELIDMNSHLRGRDWSYRGDSTGQPNHGGNGSCGGGGPNMVHSFTPPSSGRYEIKIQDVPPGGDTLLFVRNHCALAQREYEEGCNDDDAGLLSGLSLDLSADEPIFIFVDGYNGGFAAPYTLNIRPL